MGYPAKIVLQLPLSDPSSLEGFVEACLKDWVEVVFIHGPDSRAVEDAADDFIVGDGSFGEERYFVTGAFPDESIEDVLELAEDWILEGGGEGRVQAVQL